MTAARLLLRRSAALAAAAAALSLGAHPTPGHAATLSDSVWQIFQMEPENPFVGGFITPQGVALSPDGKFVYVSDSGLHHVVEMTNYGTFVKAWGYTPGPGLLKEPMGIATGPNGDVYVADQSGKVVRYDASGKFLASYPVTGAFGVAVAPGGQIYVLTRFFNVVARLAGNGQALGTFQACTPSETPEGGLNETCGVRAIAVDGSGDPLVLVNRQIHYTEECTKQAYITPEGLPTEGFDLIDRYDPAGNLISDNVSPPELPESCYQGFGSGDFYTGIAVDPTSGEYAAAQGNEAATYLNAPPGALNWSRLGRPFYPKQTPIVTGAFTAVSYDCAGNLWVASPLSGAVIRYPNLAAAACPVHPPSAAEALLPEVKLGVIGHKGKKKLKVQLGCLKHCHGPLHLLSGGKLIGLGTADLRAGTTRTFTIASRVPLRAGMRVTALFRPHGLPKAKLTSALLPQSAITLTAPAHAHVGTPITLRGAISPGRPGRLVDIAGTGPSGQTLTATATSGRHGRYKASISLGGGGKWTVTAALAPGHGLQPAAASRSVLAEPVPFAVKPASAPPAVQLGCPSAAQIGGTIALAGQAPPLSLITLTLVQPDGVRRSLLLGTDPTGALRYSFAVPEAGTWAVAASALFGTGGSCSIAVSAPPPPVAEALSIACPSSSVPLPGGKGTAVFTGTLAPPDAGKGVTVSIETKAGKHTGEAIVKEDGSYTAEIEVTTPDNGPATASASFAGDAGHLPASSTSCSFSVG